MRTTVTIDDHLLAEAKAFAAKQHRSLSAIIDDCLRATLAKQDTPQQPVKLPTFGGPDGKALVDILDKEALAEVLGDNDWPRRDDADR